MMSRMGTAMDRCQCTVAERAGRPRRSPEAAVSQWLFSKFPAQINREKMRDNRDRKSRNREFLNFPIFHENARKFISPIQSRVALRCRIGLLACRNSIVSQFEI